jgi:hypothetical protein
LTQPTTNQNVLYSDHTTTPGSPFGGRPPEVWFTKTGDFDGPGVLRNYTGIAVQANENLDTTTVDGAPFSTEINGYAGFLSPQRLYAQLNEALKQCHGDVWLYEGGDSPASFILTGRQGEQWTWTTVKPNLAINFRGKFYPGAFFRALEAVYNRTDFTEVAE